MSRPPKPTRAEILLHQEVDRLKTAAVLMRGELTDKAGAVTRLEILLRERLQRIDELNGKIDQLRDQNKRLDTEAERLAAMVRLSPSSVVS